MKFFLCAPDEPSLFTSQIPVHTSGRDDRIKGFHRFSPRKMAENRVPKTGIIKLNTVTSPILWKARSTVHREKAAAEINAI